MRIVFDPAKDRANQAKHGVSLMLADQLDWDAALAWVDERYAYDELRLAALAPVGGSLYFVVFVERDAARRIISLRRATRSEVMHYVQNI